MRNRFDKWIVISLLIYLRYTSGIHAIGTNTGQGQKPNKEGDAFLIGHPALSPPWEAIDSDSFQGKVYYSREAAESQAFAVPVGDLWAGSLDTVGHMNRSMKEQIQEKIPPEKLTPAMFIGNVPYSYQSKWPDSQWRTLRRRRALS
jgi:hypothetical protein